MNTSICRPLPPAVIDRAAGAVLASAAGDAMGAPYEFGPPQPTAPCALEGGGGFDWAPGEWTDDTQMSLAILSVLANGRTDGGAVGDEMLRWFASGPRDVGIQTRAVLGDATSRDVSPALAAAAFQQRRPDGAGNGALMRTGPVALAGIGDRARVAVLAAELAALTHPHPDSVEACVLWSLAIERAIVTATPSAPFDWVGAVLDGLDHIDPARHELWRARVEEAQRRDPADFHRSNGWVVGAFQAALAAITSTAAHRHVLPCDHLAAGLRAAARAGGDTDTVAAIAGSLLGARWGATAVPLAWRRRLHGRRVYGEAILRAADLDALARLAARGGRPDSCGWPGVAHLAYEPADPRCVEIGGALFGNAAGIARAIDAGATVIVSLCRTGASDVPDTVEHHTIGLIDSVAADNPNAAFVLLDTARTVKSMVGDGDRVFVHCAFAEHRAPTVAAALLVVGGTDLTTARSQVRAALGGGPAGFLEHALTELAAILACDER